MEQRYYLCTGPGEKEYFTLPSRWTAAHFFESPPAQYAPVANMALEALVKPVGTAPLRDLCSAAKSIAVIIDDGTRPTPVAQILAVLLPYLLDAGIPREKVTIVVALGTHVPMEKQAIEARLGKEVAAAYPIVQHDAWHPDLAPVAIPGDRRMLKINPTVAGSDFRLSISSILPHPMAGYGGGPKSLMPGVSDFEFIRDHHMRLTIHPSAKAGFDKGNPFYEDCMRAARAIGLDFSINCVYDQQGEIVGIIGGSLEASFEAATAICAEKLGHRFEEKVDVTITSTYPHTHGPQFPKAFSAPDAITREKGAILMLAPFVKPLPDVFTDSFRVIAERSGNDSARLVREAMSQGLPFLPDQPLEFNMAISCMILRPSIRTVLVSPLVSPEQAAAMGMECAPTLADGLALLERAYPAAQAAIFPSGGLVIPIEGQRGTES